jgi:hypothetical protein
MDRPPDEAGEERRETDEAEPRQADLLSLGLLVFFVSLIGVVGALLLVPVLF